MSLHTRELDAAWQKVGMEVKDGKDLHARLIVDGNLILVTRRSKGKGPIGGRIPHLIRQQMRLNETEFSDLIACPLDRAGYVRILRDKGLII